MISNLTNRCCGLLTTKVKKHYGVQCFCIKQGHAQKDLKKRVGGTIVFVVMGGINMGCQTTHARFCCRNKIGCPGEACLENNGLKRVERKT